MKLDVALVLALLAMVAWATLDRRHGCADDEAWVETVAGSMCVHVERAAPGEGRP